MKILIKLTYTVNYKMDNRQIINILVQKLMLQSKVSIFT